MRKQTFKRTPEQRRRVVELWNAGKSVDEIARLTDYSTSGVGVVLRANGITRSNKIARTPEEVERLKDRIVELHAKKIGDKRGSKILGIPLSTYNTWRVELGFKRKGMNKTPKDPPNLIHVGPNGEHGYSGFDLTEQDYLRFLDVRNARMFDNTKLIEGRHY